ncbi:MAG: glycosyltransferase [Prevotella sp.]|nr:glycosyltransferase [Prevotella sp.]
MRILQVITSLLVGGAEKLVVDLVPKLVERGHAVDVVVFNAKNMPLLSLLSERCPQCKVYQLGNSYYNPLLILKLRKIMKSYDIIHTHNSSPQLFATIANLSLGKRLITTEHSTNNRKRESKVFLWWLDKWMYKRYDRIVAISDVARNKLLEYLHWEHNCSKVITINNGVDVEMFHHAEPANDEQLGFRRTSRFVVVMVAGFREAKDQDTVVRAISHLPKDKFELWLVGVGERMETVEYLVKSLDLSDRVRFMGLRHDIPNILKAADAIIMSSHWEGLSLSNIEGMSVGKPFIASNVNGLKEVTEGAGILFPHEDPAVLSDILCRLSSDNEHYVQVAEKCYQRAKRYDLQRMVELYDNVYKAL